MKKHLLYIGILFSAASCCEKSPALQSGDLLFAAGASSAMEEAIVAATAADGSLNYIHVGIALGSEQPDSVLEASTAGVRIVPLAEFLAGAGRIGNRAAVTAKRLRDTTGVAAAVRRARSLVGTPYDFSFRPANGKLYCSELVWESYRASDGRPLFPARPMRFRAADGTMPRYWTELFEKIGEPIPEGIPGTNPNDMAREPLFEEIGRWF